MSASQAYRHWKKAYLRWWGIVLWMLLMTGLGAMLVSLPIDLFMAFMSGTLKGGVVVLLICAWCGAIMRRP